MTGGAEPQTAERILVIKLGALGDMVLALGPFAAIREHHPKAFIALLTTPPYAEIGERSGFFDHVLVDRRPGWRDIAGWLELRRKLRVGRFDRIYDLQSNDRTAMYRRLLWPGSGGWIGDSGRNGPLHAFDRHAAMLRRAGIASVLPPDLSFAAGDTSRFALPQPYALLAPGAAPHRPAKRWPAERYGQLAEIMSQRSITAAILGAAHDAALAGTILQLCPSAVDLTGRTSFLDIPALARGAIAAVGNDTGPMHLIAAAGCPSLVLFSSASDPAQSAPRGPQVTVLQRDSLALLLAAEVVALVEALTANSTASANSSAAALTPNTRP